MMNILRNVTEIVLREARMIGWSFPLQLFPAGPAGQSWAEQSYQGPHIAHLDLQGPHTGHFDLQGPHIDHLDLQALTEGKRKVYQGAE